VTAEDLFCTLVAAGDLSEVAAALRDYEEQHPDVEWVPVGNRQANRGVIEVSADAGRALVERVTNAIDAVLEAEHDSHGGVPECRSPKEAASAWLGVPEDGLAEMTTGQRRRLADRVALTIVDGGERDARIVEVRDAGTGIAPQSMPATILSLNESNKIRKHYVAGTYGQGGSSTFAVSRHTLIASRAREQQVVGFTVVRFLDLPADEFKTGHYVYAMQAGTVLQAAVGLEEFPQGTLVRHLGYDLSRYPSPLGPSSIYGLLNTVLFDPIMPVWLDSRLHGYRRVIKGSRNALNGAVDEGDAERRGPALSHNVRLYYVTLGEFGRIGIEYWVLEPPTRDNKRPSAAFVNPSRPILLTLHGQTHAELSQVLVRKAAELAYLTQRLICHIDCNHLSPDAKRALFVSNREDARRGIVYEMIEQELVKALRSDDELTRLNAEAREHGQRQQDETARQQMRREIARLLRVHGLEVTEPAGPEVANSDSDAERPTHPRVPRPRPEPLELHEPPTYVRIIWPEGEAINFHPEQRRYVRVEMDAHSSYHDANHPENSRVNVALVGAGVRSCGSTPLQGGRMRLILEATATAVVGEIGAIRVELSRPGMPVLADERPFQIVAIPPAHQGRRRIALPPFDVRPVEGPDDPQWSNLSWPDEIAQVAFTSETENGQLVVYYSTVFPRFSAQQQTFEGRDPALAVSFVRRYEIWLAVHSFLRSQDEQAQSDTRTLREMGEEEAEAVEVRERQERCRVAVLASLFAAREVQMPAVAEPEVE